jgi:hypothetical protein
MKKTAAQIRRFGSKLAVVGAGAGALASAAYAELPATVTTEITNTRSDIAEAGALIIGLAVVAMGYRWVKATFF